jgi:hypothetical protein
LRPSPSAPLPFPPNSLATSPLELLERKKAAVDAAVDTSDHPDWRAWAAAPTSSTAVCAYVRPGLSRAARLHYLAATRQEGAAAPGRALLMPGRKWASLFPGYADWEARNVGGVAPE